MSTPRISGELEAGLDQDLAGEPSCLGHGLARRLLSGGEFLPGVRAGCLSDRPQLATC